MKIIPIVMAVNEAFVPYCYVAITSIIKHACGSNMYRIYVLNTSLSTGSIQLLEGLSSQCVIVSCVDVKDVVDTNSIKSTKYLSVETYYRLYTPLLLREYKKVIYLDSDICVMSDVAELFEADLLGNAVGAVRDVFTANIEAHSKRIGIADYKGTINAGILLIDIELFEREQVREKCLNLLKEDNKQTVRNYTLADQDALNVVLHNKITFLDAVWNCQVQYLNRPQVVYDECRKEYFESISSAKILHFAGEDKLWFYPEYEPAKIFWEYAKNTPVFDQILIRAFEQSGKIIFDRYHFPYDLIPYESRIVLYGAGKVGQMFYQQMKLTRYAKVSLLADKNWEKVDKSLGVVSPKDIADCEYDYVLLTIDKRDIADKARDELTKYGIPQEKILWKQYGSVV